MATENTTAESSKDSRFTLQVQPRSASGSSTSKRLRRDGLTPCVAYSSKSGSHPLLISSRDFRRSAEQALPSQVFTFESNDGALNGRRVIVKDIQLEPVKRKVLHVDFQFLEEGEAVKIDVPVRYTGEAVGVKIGGGILAIAAKSITLRCEPDSIPEVLEVDVRSLELGKRIRAGELELPQGAVLAGTPNETLVSVVAGRAAKTAQAEEKAGAAEGEASEQAEEKSEE